MSVRHLHDLPAGYCLLHDLPDGTIQIEKIRYISRYLTEAARVAIALNEKFCERGFGRIYVLVAAPPAPPASTITQPKFKSYSTIKALPELFYVREHWSAEQQNEWRRFTPLERLHRVYARYGWVHDEVVGVPCGTDLQLVQHRRARFNGVTEAPVTILITPTPYVGLTKAFTQHCTRAYRKDKAGVTNYCVWESVNKDWADFETMRVHGAGGILDGLERLRRDNDECLMTYGAVKSWFVTAYQRAAEFEVEEVVGAEEREAVEGEEQEAAGSEEQGEVAHTAG